MDDGDLPGNTGGNEPEEFEILDVSNTAEYSRDMIARLCGALSQINPNSPAAAVGIGGAGGWIVGYVFKKVGRLAASSIGGGLFLLQVANQSGYITINWKKVNHDVGRAQNRVSNDINRNHHEVKSILSKIKKIVHDNAAFSVGFAGGFLVGMAT